MTGSDSTRDGEGSGHSSDSEDPGGIPAEGDALPAAPGKPISIRDAVGAPDRPTRKPTSDLSPNVGEPMRIPTPARAEMATDGGPIERREASSRLFRDGETEWQARISGTFRTGRPPDTGATLMHLVFEKQGAPEGSLELFTVATNLEELHEDDLKELLQRSRPLRRP